MTPLADEPHQDREPTAGPESQHGQTADSQRLSSARARSSGARRELATSVTMCLLGATMILLCAGRTWATGTPADSGVPTVTATVSGRDLAPLAAGLGLLGLAATAALLATRGLVRQAVGLIVAAAGVGVVIDSWQSRGRAAAELQAGVPGSELIATVTGWPWIAAAGGVLLGITGLVTASRSRSWPGMSRRYDAPASEPASEPANGSRGERSPDSSTTGSTTGPSAFRADEPSTDPMLDPEAAWRALDRGEDPTLRG